MSLPNPFPQHGKPNPVDVFFFFWLPVLLIVSPVIALVLLVIFKFVISLFGVAA